jgi:hypothetical protein
VERRSNGKPFAARNWLYRKRSVTISKVKIESRAVAKKQKPKRSVKKRLTKKKAVIATRRSTAGTGFDFEDYVAAWLVLQALAGRALPVHGHPQRLQMQTGSLLWDIDDILFTARGQAGDERLAVSCKGNVQVSGNGLPHSFAEQAWRLLNKADNRIAIESYGLSGEFTPEVSDAQITIYRPNPTEDARRLISYAVGCIMGRYSLDEPGLIYAGGGGKGFDAAKYVTFQADDDAIIPVFDIDWGVQKDLTNRVVEFLSIAWPRQHLEENVQFVADSLVPLGGEQSRDTIRRYLAGGFFKHHLSTYKKRPIYWLFSSGREHAFQCLVYIHRYNESTLARMRTKYIIPLQGQMSARIDQLENDKLKAANTSNRKKLQKQQDDLKKQQAELLIFEEKLKHFSDQRISLDLDDGVKVNYGKFGDLLAEVKAITGGKDDE